MLLGQRVTEESLQNVRRELGLDLPWGKQYLLYLNDVSPLSLHNKANDRSRIYLDPTTYSYFTLLPLGDYALVAKVPFLRRSFQSRKAVSEIIGEALPGTLTLAFVAITFALFFGVLFGVLSAMYKGSFFDDFTLFTAIIGMSLPSFFAAIIFSWLGGFLWAKAIHIPALPFIFGLMAALFMLFGTKTKNFKKLIILFLRGAAIGIVILVVFKIVDVLFGWSLLSLVNWNFALPGTGLNMTGSLYDVDVFTGEYLSLSNLILPAITLGVRPLAIIIQLTRNALLDVMSQDFIRTARAKGLTPARVWLRHGLRNALNPVITAVSGWFASMLAGAVFIEFVFNWKGIGLQVFQSLQNDDYPVVMGSVLVIAAAFVLINLVVDILYGVLDPRIRIQ